MFSSCYLFFVIVLYPVFLRFHFRCRPMGNVAVRVTWSWSMPLDWNDGTVCIFGKTKKTFVVSLVPKPFLFSFAPLRSSRETGMERRFGTPRDAANASWKRIKICFFFFCFVFFSTFCALISSRCLVLGSSFLSPLEWADGAVVVVVVVVALLRILSWLARKAPERPSADPPPPSTSPLCGRRFNVAQWNVRSIFDLFFVPRSPFLP